MNTNDLNTALYEKMAAEQDKYRDWLKSQPPEEILHHTYEYTVREDIVMAMEELDLTDAQAQALLESPSPLADVYRYFEKLETGYMDVIRDSIENRADDVCRAKEELQTTPVYPHSAAYAKEHGELEQYRASNNVNLQCKEAIEAAVREHFDGMYLSHDAAKGVIEIYGMERVAMVLANTVQLQDWDGRYSRRNKEWAKTIPNENPETVLKLDGVGQNQSHTLHAIGLDHTLCRIVTEIHSVEVFPHRRFNGLLALEICIVGNPVLLQFPMFSRIGGRVGIDRCCSQFLFSSAHIVGTVLNTVPDHIHIAGLQLFKITVHIRQRRGRFQKRLGLCVGQLQLLHRHHNILTDSIFIGVVQDFFRGLAFQPVPIFFLLSGHLFIKGRIQIIGIHVIAPPQAVLVSCLYCGASPGASGCPAPKSVCFWQQQPRRVPVPFRRC